LPDVDEREHPVPRPLPSSRPAFGGREDVGLTLARGGLSKCAEPEDAAALSTDRSASHVSVCRSRAIAASASCGAGIQIDTPWTCAQVVRCGGLIEQVTRLTHVLDELSIRC